MIRIFILWKTESIFPCMTQPDIFIWKDSRGIRIGSRDFWIGEVREIKDKAGEEDWYIYDLFFRPGEGKEIYVRGVISVTESEESFQTILRIAFILLPLLAAATAFVGYRFTKRTLKPVKDITDTVCKIRMDADLSRRIDNIDTVRETKEKR